MNKDIQQLSMLDQDSQNSSDQDQSQININKPSNNCPKGSHCILIIIIVIIGVASIIKIVLLGQSYSTNKNNDPNLKQFAGQQLFKNQINNIQSGNNPKNMVIEHSPSLIIRNRQNQIQSIHKIQDIQILQKNKPRQKLILKKIIIQNNTKTNFIQKDLYNGNMLWSQKLNLICQSDLIINSASKISEDLYLQKTAYEDLNILQHNVDIPAENIYRFESIRQFLSNITKKNSQYIIVFDHHNPLLFMIALSMSSKGIFVNRQKYWTLLQQNLVLNDVLPFANPINKSQISKKDGYQILITNDQKFIKDILFQQKREITIILLLQQPKKMQTFILRKMNFYKFLQGEECRPRQFQIYEQSAWRIEDEVWILSGIYIVTLDFVDLPIDFQHKNYQQPLYNHKNITCIKKIDYNAQSYELNQQYLIRNLPYQGLFLMKQKNDSQIDKNDYREIMNYLKQFPIKQKIYLDSGSYYLFLLICYASDKNTSIYLNPQYEHAYMFYKNLVINNLQKLQTFDKAEINNYSLVVTKDHTLLQNQKNQRILLVVQKNIMIDLKKYNVYRFIQIGECQKSILEQIASVSLSEGVYLMTKIL